MTALRRLVLVRHGETEGESSIRYHGANDVPLSELGCAQMQRVARELAGERFDAVWVSRLRRTRAAARIIAPEVEAEPIAGFDEIHFGDWEGLTREEIAARDPELSRLWRAGDDDFQYPGGDRVGDFRARVAAAWRELLPRAPERVLVVAHRGVISTLLMETLGVELDELRRWRLDLGSLHILVARDDGWTAELTDHHRHLEG
jgi:broad specificity phosphatase PhoE